MHPQARPRDRRLEQRIGSLYDEADPKGLVLSAPGVGRHLAGGILGRLGDANRFANLAGIRSFSGMVPRMDQSGLNNRHPGNDQTRRLGAARRLWYLAADLARKGDPQWPPNTTASSSTAGSTTTRRSAPRHHPAHPHRRLLAHRPALHPPRRRRPPDHSRPSARAIIAERYKVSAEVRAARRRTGAAQQMKKGAGRGSKESTKAAPASDPPAAKAIPVAGAA